MDQDVPWSNDMQFIDFSMHLEGNQVVQLVDLLSVIPDNNWHWSILDFCGVGVLPIGLSMEEFEEKIRSAPKGYYFSWEKLKMFADHLEQTWDCLIVAVESENDLVAEELKADNFDRCVIVLIAFDSTSWSVGTHELNLLNRFDKFIEHRQSNRISTIKDNILLRGPSRPLG